MDVSEFDYQLPDELIAQEPVPERGTSRLLVLNRDSGRLVDAMFSELPRYLNASDLLVLNNTRVFPARLLGHRVPSGGAVECLLLRQLPTVDGRSVWESLVHPGQKLKPGACVLFEGDGVQLHGEILDRRFFGRRVVQLWTDDGSEVQDVIDRIGHMPLPPYIKREDRPSDRQRYQTVYARARGSVAAPTAGLHFTENLLAGLAAHGVECTEITLHVGYGTFKPVRVDHVEDHAVDAEPFVVGPSAAEALSRARREGRRIIAVGTTTTRALESLEIRHDGSIPASSGETRLFIHPGHQFRLVGGMITNFHLPRSSLLMLVAALAGRENVLNAYRTAVDRRYRFYSYGDAMLIL